MPKGKRKGNSGRKRRPNSAYVSVLVHDPPSKFDPKGWEEYYIVPLDKYANVLLVASQGQEVWFYPGQSTVDDIFLGGDSSRPSPPANP
jgi:hypothetical protein